MQVLAIDDPWIPPDMEIPRRGAVPVRFFGTYNFTWIESQRNLMAFDQGSQDDLPSKGNTKVCTGFFGCLLRIQNHGCPCQPQHYLPFLCALLVAQPLLRMFK